MRLPGHRKNNIRPLFPHNNTTTHLKPFRHVCRPHQDMLCISLLTLVNSLLGFPFLVAATVRRSVPPSNTFRPFCPLSAARSSLLNAFTHPEHICACASLNHVRALASFKETESGGYAIESIMENRLTGTYLSLTLLTSGGPHAIG